MSGVTEIDKDLEEIPLLPEETEIDGTETLYIVKDGIDYRVPFSRLNEINDPALALKADLVDGVIPIEQIPDIGIVAAEDLTGAEIPQLIKKAASANVRNSHDAEITTTSTSLVKLKTITLTKGLIGTARFLFDIKATNEGFVEGKARIYRNGVAIGGLTTYHATTYVTISEDLTQTWNAGDTCELWGTTLANGVLYLKNFRIAYDDSPTVAVPSTNS